MDKVRDILFVLGCVLFAVGIACEFLLLIWCGLAIVILTLVIWR